MTADGVQEARLAYQSAVEHAHAERVENLNTGRKRDISECEALVEECWSELESAIRAADARTLRVLREVEWRGRIASYPAPRTSYGCPSCYVPRDRGLVGTHTEDCALAADITRLESALEGT